MIFNRAFWGNIVFKTIKPIIKLFSDRDLWEERIFQCKRVIFGDSYVIQDAKIQYIDKHKVDQLIHISEDICGIDANKKSPQIIVSLTSYGERIADIKYTLFSLVNQTVKPNQIILWLAPNDFTEALASQFHPYGITVNVCEDIKSYKKLIPALRSNPDDIIITADDDIYYPPCWLEHLLVAYMKQPQCIHCHYAKLIRFDDKGGLLPFRQWKNVQVESKLSASFCILPIGCGGVLYPPYSLYQDVTNKDLFTELAPFGDDLWFWAMAVMQGTKINVVENNIDTITYVDPAKELGIDSNPLWKINVWRRYNDKQLKALFASYPTLQQRV